MLVLNEPDGYPAASTISVSRADGVKWITFCTGHGPKDVRIAYSNKACVCFSSPTYHISLTGTAEIITDPEVKKEMWYGGLSNHFSGPEDPNYIVIKFTSERANLLIDWQDYKGTI